MNQRVIEAVLRNKFKDFSSSIEDENLREEVRNNSIITGGCITSMLLKERVNDFDLYFTCKETTKKVAEYFVKKFLSVESNKIKHGGLFVSDKGGRISICVPSAGIATENQEEQYRFFETLPINSEEQAKYFEEIAHTVVKTEVKKKDGKYIPLCLTSNAITLTNKVQLIIRFYGSTAEIHKNFDYVHATNYWTKGEGLVLNKEALASTLTKELFYLGSLYPVCSIFRLRKFLSNGWTITAGQLFKIMYQINELDLKNIHVLDDQLMGVDVAYFGELLSKLRNDLKDGTIKTVDSTYIMTLIETLR